MTVTIGFTEDFASPLYTGTSTSSDVPYKFPAAIQGHPYMIEPSLYEKATVDFRRDSADQSQEPGEHSLTNRGSWRRLAREWGWGAGQDRWDGPDSDRRRFRSSKGIDVFSRRDRIQLHNDTRNIRATTATNLTTLAVGNYLYVTDGNDLLHTTDPAVASPTWVDADIEDADTPGTVSDITTDGVRVYGALGANGVHSTLLGDTTSVSLTTYAATLVEYANGRLFAAKAGELVEVESGGTTTAVLTHAISTFAWTAVAGAPNGVFAGGNAGDRSQWYFIGINASNGELTVPTPIVPLPDGETLNAMQFYGGVMLIGTSLGLRLAVVGDGALAYGPAIEIEGGVTALEPQGADCWFGWKNYDATSTGTGRVRLSRRQVDDQLVPAYASDLMATGQGTIGGIATFGEKRYFAVNGVGIFAEFTNKVASGTISSGTIDFGVPEPKALTSASVRHDALAGEVAVSITKDDGTSVAVGTSQLAGSLAPDSPFAVPNIKTENVEVVLTLERSGSVATTGPAVLRWALRGLVAPQLRVDEWSLPIILTQEISNTAGEISDQDPLGEYLFLQDLVVSGTPVTFQLGTETYPVQIERITAPRSDDREWTDDHAFLEGIYLLSIISIEG